MTQDEIISMAREAGAGIGTSGRWLVTQDELQRFAALVATAERRKHQADIERWKAEAATAEKWRGLALSKDGDGRCVQRIQQEAAEKEREACAKLCDDMKEAAETLMEHPDYSGRFEYERMVAFEDVAEAIRARSTT